MTDFPKGMYFPLLPNARRATTGGSEQAKPAGRRPFSRPARTWARAAPMPSLAAFILLFLLAALVLPAAAPGPFAAEEGAAPARPVNRPLSIVDFPPGLPLEPRRGWPSSGYTQFEERELLSLDGIDPRLQPVCVHWTNKCIECERWLYEDKPSVTRCRITGWLDLGETACKPVETRCLSLNALKAYDEVCRSWRSGWGSCGNPRDRLCRRSIVLGIAPWMFPVECEFHEEKK
jgi:hypothetical protein